MRLNKFNVITILIMVFSLYQFSYSAFADNKKHDDLVKELIKILKISENATASAMTYIKNNPNLNSNPNLVKDLNLFYTQLFTDKSYLEKISDSYKKHFTEDELTKIIAFYKSKEGSKLTQKNPVIFQEMQSFNQKLIESKKPELEKIFDKYR